MTISPRVAELLARMTLEEKIGQMTQVSRVGLQPEAVGRYSIGSVLSGGGAYPLENTPKGWAEMVSEYQQAALGTRLGIPILYGVDAVHGHNNLYGAVIFPHNIGLGAARDPLLVQQIGRATAEEMAACGLHWNFAPTVAVPQDLRWGRAFEGFGQDSTLVAQLGAAYIKGLQADQLGDPLSVLATAKHFIGDGGTSWGSSRWPTPIPPVHPSEPGLEGTEYMLDQGDSRIDEATLRTVHLPPYIAAIDAGVKIIMASFSSWNGLKMHAHRYLLTEVLKGELGFDGFIISDWGGIDQVADDYYQAVVRSINAGVDMVMVPLDYERFIASMKLAVQQGEIPIERIDDAVQRILDVKEQAGLFEHPLPDPRFASLVGTEAHRRLGREAAAKSLVLLKNERQIVPLSKSTSTILVAGVAANDIGLQCGGWTIEWLGKPGAITPGTTILEGIRNTVSPDTNVLYQPDGQFAKSRQRQGGGWHCGACREAVC